MPARKHFITKHLGVPLEKGFLTQDDGSIVVRGFFTSDNVDEIGDIIAREATEAAIPKYRQWGNIRYMHMPKPVAKVVNIGKDDGLKWNEVEIQVIDPEAVFQVKNGLLTALSVGIIIKSWDDIEIDEETGTWTILQYDLVEISLVDHPANYDALLFLDDDKSIPVSAELRQLVATNGFAVVSKALGALTTSEEEIDMAELEENLQADEEEEVESVEEEVELSVESEEEDEEEQEVLEALDSEDSEVSDETDVEELVDADLAGTIEEGEDAPWSDEEEEVVEEDLLLEEMEVEFADADENTDDIDSVLTDSQEADGDTEEEETIEDADDEEEVEVILENTPESVIDLAQALIDALSEAEAEALEVEESTEVEEQLTVEEAETDEDEATLKSQVADLEGQVAELTRAVADLLKPAKRMGQVKTTVLPHEAVEEVEAADTEGEPDLLKKALRSYIDRPARVQIRDRS